MTRVQLIARYHGKKVELLRRAAKSAGYGDGTDDRLTGKEIDTDGDGVIDYTDGSVNDAGQIILRSQRPRR